MSKFSLGEIVAVPCTVQQGAFPEEFLVTVDTLNGPVSGFARRADLVGNDSALQAVVQNMTQQVLTVRLAGSFFTTNGLAEFDAGWAQQRIKAIA